MSRILIIDDDDAIRRTLELHLRERGFDTASADSIARGRATWNDFEPRIVILDLKLPDGEGISLLEEQVAAGTTALIILVTGHSDLEYAIRAMKAGAFNYIHKPVNIDELDVVIDRADSEARLRSRMSNAEARDADYRPDRIAGHSAAIIELHKQIGILARSRVNVLISGETGTGKELVARAIHRSSAADQPFVAVNCSAIVPTLLESELFGHERGAFTGAHQRKIGKFELAQSGTLFLDEIGDLTLGLQAKILRVVQERTFERVGGTAAIRFEARLIAATHRELGALVKGGSFREDLYFRLKVAQVRVPALRERKRDLPELVHHILEKAGRELHQPVSGVTPGVLAKLTKYDWPGNVRELENVLIRSLLRSSGPVIGEVVLEDSEVHVRAEYKSLADVEREHIRRTLNEVGGNLGKACEVLGITRPTLRKKMEEYGIGSGKE
ncbi:sigma-54-dependent Fis family transcriptional regulator [candidate division KSB1 bacterium]|nr:sigma-54-dependent Fis family transcriptional regulator [candidate division KSB1 bacterium]